MTREDFSPENRQQIEALLKVLWGDLRDSVAVSRQITPAKLQELVDQEGLISAPLAKEQGLVTELAYEGEALDKLRCWDRARRTSANRFPKSPSANMPAA